MQNFSLLLAPREIFLKWGLNKRGKGKKNVRFSTEKWPYLRNGERYGLGYY